MIRSLIIKVASTCNLSCDYCYFSRSENLKTDQRILPMELLRATIAHTAEYCKQNDLGDFVFCWHGGEPLLAGYDFYESIIELQRDFFPKKVQIDNVIQTNGMLLTDRWVDLFKRHDFQVALSLDGPAAINDLRRKTKNGRGTSRYLVDRIELLKRNAYPVRILAVITPEAVPLGKEIYKYFRDLGCCWMDFLYPICNWIDNTFDKQIDPCDPGKFLCDVFDAWIEEGNPDVYVRTLHDWCMLIMGGQTITCHSRTDCSYVLTINTDGSVHVCDDLAPYTDSLLGHIMSDSFSDIEVNENLKRLENMSALFGKECSECEYFPVCRGGCTIFRAKAIGDFTAHNYYCQSQKMTVRHIKGVLDALAAGIQTANPNN